MLYISLYCLRHQVLKNFSKRIIQPTGTPLYSQSPQPSWLACTPWADTCWQIQALQWTRMNVLKALAKTMLLLFVLEDIRGLCSDLLVVIRRPSSRRCGELVVDACVSSLFLPKRQNTLAALRRRHSCRKLKREKTKVLTPSWMFTSWWSQ